MVVAMKIMILNKKILILFILLISLLFFILISFYHPFSFAYELTTNSIIDNELKDKISSITKSNEKIAYLTFDDGPTIKATPKILDILKEENVKATFFVIGKYVKNHPDIVKREYEEGHFLANHGYSHNNALLYKSKDAFLNEIRSTDAAIGKAIGLPNYKCHLFRFPNGSVSNIYHKQKMQAISFLSEIDYTYIDWNVVNNDSIRKYSQNQLLNNLKKSCKGKNTIVILMHDTGDVNNTYDVLEDSIAFLKQEGYVFKTFHDFFKS